MHSPKRLQIWHIYRYLDIKSSNTQTANTCTRALTHTHRHTPSHPHIRTQTHILIHTGISGRGHCGKGFQKEKGFQGRFEGTDRGYVTDRSGKFVLCCWSLVRERTLTTWLCAKGWYSENSCVCRRTELPRSVKVKKIWEVGRGRTIQKFKAIWSEFEINPFFFNWEPV